MQAENLLSCHLLSIAEPHAMIVVESMSLDQCIDPGIQKYMYEIRIRKGLKISKKVKCFEVFSSCLLKCFRILLCYVIW